MKKRRKLDIPIEDMEALAELNKMAQSIKTLERIESEHKKEESK